jgi:hypothetical protein
VNRPPHDKRDRRRFTKGKQNPKFEVDAKGGHHRYAYRAAIYAFSPHKKPFIMRHTYTQNQ